LTYGEREMYEFQSAEELLAHYDAVRARIRRPRAAIIELPARVVAEEPPLPPEEPVEALEPDPTVILNKQGKPIQLPKVIVRPQGVDEAPMILPKIWLEEVTMLVCNHLQMTPEEVWSQRRWKEITRARFLIWALAREFCHQHSLPSIGRFCNRDHTTVLHGAVQGRTLSAYPELAAKVREILELRRAEAQAQVSQSQRVASEPQGSPVL
jgi:hypothetical protein